MSAVFLRSFRCRDISSIVEGHQKGSTWSGSGLAMINYGESHGRFLIIYNGFICFCVALPFKVTARLPACQVRTRQLQAQLSQAQLQNTSKVSDATALKREVVAKTMELEKLAREFQQSQSDLFSRVHSVSDSFASNVTRSSSTRKWVK